MSSILEINENEYLIKLNRKRFNLSFVRSLLKMVEIFSPSDDNSATEMHYLPTRQHVSAEPDYFGSLEEK